MLSPLTIVSLDQGKLYRPGSGPNELEGRPMFDASPAEVGVPDAGRYARSVFRVEHLIRQLREWRAAGRWQPSA